MNKKKGNRKKRKRIYETCDHDPQEKYQQFSCSRVKF